MSKYLSSELRKLVPYVPGEQPRDMQYIKLNTNESPFPPAPGVQDAVQAESGNLQLYSDPGAYELISAIADGFNVDESQVFVGNGSDEVLAFVFHAYGENGFCGPELSYGFYPVFANFFGIDYETIPMNSDLSFELERFDGRRAIVFANPNAQTGLYIEPERIESLLKRVDVPVIVDEAYIDFGGKSVIPLIDRYKNLIVVGTFSKSRNLAGARVGFAVGDIDLISELNTLKFSFNPYNINRMSIAAGAAAMRDMQYFKYCTGEIIKQRERTKAELCKLGFEVTDSKSNFLLAKCEKISGKELYIKLKERGILVRYLGDEIIKNHVRITVGTKEQMDTLLSEIRNILGGIK